MCLDVYRAAAGFESGCESIIFNRQLSAKDKVLDLFPAFVRVWAVECTVSVGVNPEY